MQFLICKKTGKSFEDFHNRSGIITEHLRSMGIDVPTSYKRRRYLDEHGKYWHIQFFDIEEKEEQKKFKCKYCDWETIDLENQSGCYTTHLINSHNINLENYLNSFPEESFKFKTFIIKKEKEEETIQENNHVECKICGLKVRYLTNTHLRKHNIIPEEYKRKFGIESYSSIEFKQKIRKKLSKASSLIQKTFISKPEKELKNFLIEDCNLEILCNNKSFFGIEINIIIPKNNLCIEFNGNLYHSEIYGGKDRNYHIDKTNICKQKGYKLIHIHEDEWFLKNNITKEKIKNILKLSNDKEKIYARKCIIKTIDSKLKNEFLNKNHIQGEDRSDISLGAFYEDKLVSVISFGKKRNMISKKDEGIELRRFASDINYNVIGIFSKFISYFRKNYDYSKLYTFLDLRWNPDQNDNVYMKNGFILEKYIKPDYTYYNSKISRYRRFHKFSFGKSMLKNKFPDIFDIKKTEWEIMRQVGYDRIWDCGKYKFVLSN